VTWRTPAAVALVAFAAVAFAPAGHAARVAVVVVPSLDPAAYAENGAVGLLVPGAGSTVTREGAISSLVRGKVVSSLLGGRAAGEPLIRLSRSPGAVTVYVSLPPRGKSHNTRRYPIAIVGAGYRGVLVSRTTRIAGLVSIADVAPTAVALANARAPRIRWRPDNSAAATIAALDRRLGRAHDSRNAATIVLVASTLVLAGLGLLFRSAVLARAGLLAIPGSLAVAASLAALGVTRPAATTIALALGTVAVALGAALARVVLQPALVMFLVAFLVVLAIWPEVNALSAIGPHPDGGGRYYGVTNEVETLLLAPVLAAAALGSGLSFVLVGAIALTLVGWSRTGADGGGIVVVLVALGGLWVIRERVRITPARVAASLVALVAVALALVGVDALTGGSSHVTRAVGDGPGALLDDLGHRLRISWKGIVATTQAEVTAGANLVALGFVAALRPRVAVVDALLLGLVASLVVNDTPTDVLAYGALAAAALRVWASVDARATARSGEPVFLPALPGPLAR
jgi:hypothetical protein